MLCARLVLFLRGHACWVGRRSRRFSSATEGGGGRPAIVLAHGFFGGRKLPLIPVRYFRGVAEDLRLAGYEVLVTEVQSTASVALRAEQLCEQIFRWPGRDGKRVVALAHSMGGLDMRYAISKLGGDSYVSTLLTISTPHRGSPVADLLVRTGEKTMLFNLMESLPVQLLADAPNGGRCLCTHAAQEFNESVPDSSKVHYLSVGGSRGTALRTSPELILTHLYIASLEGPNDGMVSVKSARWGEYIQTLDMDHLHQMNFPLPHRWITGAPSYTEVVCTYRKLAAVAAANAPLEEEVPR